MTSLYGTDTNYSLWMNNFPLDNIPENDSKSGFTYNLGKNTFKYKQTEYTNEDQNLPEYKKYNKKEENKGNKTTIGNALSLFSYFSQIYKLVGTDEAIFDILNKENVTFFAPTDAYYDELDLYFQKTIPKEFGDRYRAMKIKEILQCHIVSDVIYPEQLYERNSKIQTLSKTNDLVFEGNILKSPNHSKILQAIECDNGVIYRISHPILPEFLFGV